jgi:two-component system OmpR family sensor kinase
MAVALVVLAQFVPSDAFGDIERLDRVQVAAGALAVLSGVAAAVRSRVDGYAPSWWVGLALLAVGVAAVGDGPRSTMSASLHVATACVALMCVARAALSTEVDSGVRPLRTSVLAGAVFVAVLALGDQLMESASAHRISNLVIGIAFGVLAIVVIRRRRANSAFLWPALAPILAGMALADLVAASVATGHPLHSGGAATVLMATMGFATVRTVGDLHAASALQRDAAFQSHLLRREAEQGRRQVEDRFAEKMHEVRSTVRALEGGVRRLDVGHAGDAEMLGGSALASALVAEIQRLQALATDEHERSEPTRYDVRTVLEPMLTVSAAGGWPVSWSIPAGLEASGRPGDLAQVVHGLLANSTRHAPGTPIDVTARRDAEFVLVTVEDRGPGVDRRAREAIFQRGAHTLLPEDEGQGLGLYIARSLVRREGGDIWVEPRARGGARFVVAVPTADPAARRLGDSLGVVRPFVRPAPSRRPGAFGRRFASSR